MFDQDARRVDPTVDETLVPVDIDRELELNELRGLVDAERTEQVEPERLRVGLLGAALAPLVDELFDGVLPIAVDHCEYPAFDCHV